jgi:arsenate reductase
MNGKKGRLRILFLCTGNSCRSQMAEGWARHLKADHIEAFSAGTDPKGLNPRAVQVMKEAGVDISGQRSKHVGELLDQEFDYVVTLCGAAREACPVFPGNTKLRHVGFEDPAAAEGTEEEIMAVFRRVRDQIKRLIESLPGCLETESNGG